MRKAKLEKRVVLPDPKFNGQKVSKFVSHLMYDGKKNTPYETFHATPDIISGKMKDEEKSPLEVWKQALDDITPQVKVKSRCIGGATLQVPAEIRPDRRESISMRNMITLVCKHGDKSMANKLASEIMDTFNNQDGAHKRREGMYRATEANHALTHFRF